jgi:hypothetical protein
MMKKLVLFLLAFAMVFSMVTACGKKKDEQDDAGFVEDKLEDLPVQLADDTKELLDQIDSAVNGSTASAAKTDVKITVDLPEGWTEKENPINMLAAYEKGTTMVNVLEPYAPSSVKNTAELAEYEKEQLKGFFEDVVFSEIESITVSGIKGSRLSMEITIGKTLKQTQSYVYLEKDGVYYKIMIAYFSDDEQGKREAEEVLTSLKIE